MSATQTVKGAPAGATQAISFPESLPGLEGAQLWELVEHEQAQPFLWLRSVDRPPLALLVIDPRLLLDYRPAISAADLARVGLSSGAQVLMLAVVTLRDAGATVNLRAPILINPKEMLGTQVILEDSKWSFRHPVLDETDDGDEDHEGTGRSRSCSSSAEKPASR